MLEANDGSVVLLHFGIDVGHLLVAEKFRNGVTVCMGAVPKFAIELESEFVLFGLGKHLGKHRVDLAGDLV